MSRVGAVRSVTDDVVQFLSGAGMLRPLGLQQRRGGYVLPTILVLSAGALVGVAGALLWAPMPGREMRRKLRSWADGLYNTKRAKKPASNGEQAIPEGRAPERRPADGADA